MRELTQQYDPQTMRVLATYRGTVRDFRAWLAAGMPNVASLAEYREKKTKG